MDRVAGERGRGGRTRQVLPEGPDPGDDTAREGLDLADDPAGERRDIADDTLREATDVTDGLTGDREDSGHGPARDGRQHILCGGVRDRRGGGDGTLRGDARTTLQGTRTPGY
ncbi:hypothetical protein [Streptomyces sp. NBC_00829]|uniref:hypothetical protein n=1 Tax=Streptomyces sp. NBC_00829 TaxID=2903679 RepID=UPI0038691528|nr:hypothetical protein OG293_13440 [Streptomyces sp. NBC_00829]